MLEFEFYLGTGNSPPVCCRQLIYGLNESMIMTYQIVDLETNGLITDCEVAWKSLLVLTAKPHKQRYNDINTLIWRVIDH